MLTTLDHAAEAIPEAVRAGLLAGTAEVDRWPTDSEFRDAWMTNALYENLTRPRLRLILEALESGLRNDFSETDAVPRNLTVEHILPQSWQAYWPLPADAGDGSAAERRSRLLHTLGNLTLLNRKLNPAQSNRPWATSGEIKGKREALAEHSVLHLNHALAVHEAWDEAAIEERGSILFEVARTIWPRPAGAAPPADQQSAVSA